MRDYFKEHVGGNAGLYSLAVGALVGAALFALTARFTRANEVESGQVIAEETMIAGHSRPIAGEVIESRST